MMMTGIDIKDFEAAEALVKSSNKIKLFTHVDFDGIGCAILCKLAYDNPDIEYLNYENVNEVIKTFLLSEDCKNYKKILIADISVNEEVAGIIDEFFTSKVLLFDHHTTALWLNKYSWCKVEEKTYGNKTCGTQLLFQYLSSGLLDNISITNLDCREVRLLDFVNIVNKYDNYLFVETGDPEPKKWNDLLYIVGREEFIELVINKINSGNELKLDDFEERLLKYKQKEIDAYIEAKDKQLIRTDILGFKAGVVFAEMYCSELGNKLCKMNPDIDFCVIINVSRSVSYRAVTECCHLGIHVAMKFGGSGKALTAGSPLPEGLREKIIEIIFRKEVEE